MVKVEINFTATPHVINASDDKIFNCHNINIRLTKQKYFQTMGMGIGLGDGEGEGCDGLPSVTLGCVGIRLPYKTQVCFRRLASSSFFSMQ